MPASIEDLAQRFGPRYCWIATATVMTGTVAAVLSATIVNVALPDIMGEFGIGQDKAQWMSTAFLAAMTATMLTAAWCQAAFGIARAFSGSMIVFLLASVLGGMAPNDVILIAARTGQGAAAGLIQTLAMVVVFSVFPPQRRGLAMGIYGVGVILAPALGPTIGGLLIDSYSWHWVFFLAPPFCLIGAVLGPRTLPSIRAEIRPPFDLVGFILLVIGLSGFLTGLSNGQRQGWDSPFETTAFATALVGLGAFLMWERRVARPLLSFAVFSNPRFLAASFVAFVLGLGLYGSTYLIPLFVQTVQGYTPTRSGLLLMPAGLALGVIFPLAGRLSDRISPHIMIMSGLALFSLSSWLMVQVDTSTDFLVFAWWIVVGRVGLGLILPSLNSGALKVLPPTLLAPGAGAINFIRQLGGAVGVSLLSIVLERQTTLGASELNNVISTVQSDDGIHAIMYTIAGLLEIGGLAEPYREISTVQFVTEMISAQARVLGFRISFLVVAGLFLAAILPAWFMRARRKKA